VKKASEIRFVSREDIDLARWDSCVQDCACSLIYAHSFWLDAMALRWDGLVLNDYEAVMPLTWNSKWGIRYLFQPPFTQQLGVFGSPQNIREAGGQFISEARKRFRFAEIYLHFGMEETVGQSRNNFVLDLGSSYGEIRGQYKEYLRRDIRQLEKKDLAYRSSLDYQEVIELFIAFYAGRVPHLKVRDFQAFRNLCQEAMVKDMLLIRKVYSSANKILSLGLFFKDNGRIYHVMSVTPPEGRRLQANHYLLDELIREFAGKRLLLDFEGSDIPGVAWFYRKFGARLQTYRFLRYNRLPPPLRWLK
jgi:hypothetical protein